MTRRWILPSYDGIDAIEIEQTEAGSPGAGEVAVRATAIGVNPSDAKSLSGGWNADPSKLPLPIGQELAGVVTAIGPDVTGFSVGDPVVVWKIAGAFATEVIAPATEVFPLPAGLDPVMAGGLLHVAATAYDLLHLVDPAEGATLLVHGASGSVGVCVLQLAALRGIRVIGTSSEANFDKVRSFGAEPVAYGNGLADRVRALAPDGVDVAIDAAGTDEALAVSRELVDDPARIATVAPGRAAQEAGVKVSAGMSPASIAVRMPARAELLRLAGEGRLTVPVARTVPFDDAQEALRLVAGGHPGGKVVLVP